MIRPFTHPDVNIAENIDDIAVGEIEIDRECRDDSIAIYYWVAARWTAPATDATHRPLDGTSSPPDGRRRCGATNAGWAVVVCRSDHAGLRRP